MSPVELKQVENNPRLNLLNNSSWNVQTFQFEADLENSNFLHVLHLDCLMSPKRHLHLDYNWSFTTPS